MWVVVWDKLAAAVVRLWLAERDRPRLTAAAVERRRRQSEEVACHSVEKEAGMCEVVVSHAADPQTWRLARVRIVCGLQSQHHSNIRRVHVVALRSCPVASANRGLPTSSGDR